MNGVNETEMPVTGEEAASAAEMDQQPATDAGAATVTEAEYEQVKRERDQLLDRIARLQAEFDNARKREAKERAEFRDYAMGNAAEGLLPVLDNLDLAMNAKGNADQFRTGVELIAKQLEDAIRALGIVPVESVGTQFDPRVHEALGQVDTPEHPDGTVLHEVRRGYKIKEKLLRPALVQVARNTSLHEA